MKILCLSHFLKNDLSCYNNEKNILMDHYKNNELKVTFLGHIGTHIDFPRHILNSGKSTCNYTLSDFIFESPYVLEVNTTGNYIDISEVKNVPSDVDFLIFKTTKIQNRFCNDYALNNVGIGLELAQFLRENFPKLKAIGINSISINAYKDKEQGRLAHKELLGKTPEILIVEDMKLDEIKEGKLKKVIASPLLLDEADGVPVTVFAEVLE